MTQKLKPPLPPMEARLVNEIPRGDEWQYEPKWDGFRCLAFRDGDSIELQSKAGETLTRYFPEVVELLAGVKADHFVLDGELVIAQGQHLSFDALLQRIHPAASRVKNLSVETPATYIVFDLLAGTDGKSLLQQPLKQRRDELEALAGKYFDSPQLRLSPATTKYATVEKWFESAGAALDGVMAKLRDAPYHSCDRDGMVKIKPVRTADCVVGGFRYASKGHYIGSILLGLYNDEGLLDHIGFSSGFKKDEREALTEKLEKLIKAPGFTGNKPGGPSRWSTERSTEWQPLATKLVVEVSYDHFTGGRFRHGTKVLRWRPDKSPRQCTIEQVRPAASAGSLKLLK